MIKKNEYFKNIGFRKRVKEEIYDTSKNKLFVGNWEKIKLIEAFNKNNKKFEGMNIKEIGIQRK